MHYLYLAGAIVAEVIATSALKAADGFRNWPPLILAYAGYVVAFGGLAMALRTMKLGLAYAIWSGAGIVLLSAIGWLMYGQKLDAPALIGIALILAGVLVINLGSGVVVR